MRFPGAQQVQDPLLAQCKNHSELNLVYFPVRKSQTFVWTGCIWMIFSIKNYMPSFRINVESSILLKLKLILIYSKPSFEEVFTRYDTRHFKWNFTLVYPHTISSKIYFTNKIIWVHDLPCIHRRLYTPIVLFSKNGFAAVRWIEKFIIVLACLMKYRVLLSHYFPLLE